jgi:hypothetical protein
VHQLSYGMSGVGVGVGAGGVGHHTIPSNTGVDLNGGVGSSSGVGIMNPGVVNHGMDFGFGFSHAWGAPPIPGMHHGSAG